MWLFLMFSSTDFNEKSEKILDEKRGKCRNVLNYFEILRNSKIKIRTQILLKIDEK
jgi:hypothetical protein